MMDESTAEKLDDYRFQMGHEAGTLALVLDQLTDVMAMVAIHGTYCRIERGPSLGQPVQSIRDTLKLLDQTKTLVRELLEHERAKP